MSEPSRSFLAEQIRVVREGIADTYHVLRQKGPGKITFWFIALAIGIAAGFAAMLFRKSITALQSMLYGVQDVEKLHSFISELPWYWVIAIPTLGGLAVGLILHHFTPDARARSVSDVILGSALHEGRVERRAGIASAFASLITLSTGGSSGREGPVVHIAGVIASHVSARLNANGITGRDLLGCAVAAAVSASFNAPIAGALFALEVVLRHFAVHAFAPIVIASVAGTVINRIEFGGVTEFVLPTYGDLQFYVELPAFLLLGLTCGLVSVALIRSVFWVDDFGDYIQQKFNLPRWLRPMVAGLILGVLALWFPHIIGVGYETTSLALTGQLVFHEAFVFAILKVIAVSITLGGRMGGGVFSPSLMVGALTGLAFGLVATGVLPDVSGSSSLYALAGMGAVSAAVLGAPISTTLIVFEMTGDWQTGLAVMVAVSMSSALSSRIIDRSFFLAQIERRGIHLAAGPQAYLLSMFTVAKVMRGKGHDRAAPEEECWKLIGEGRYLDGSATLETAMPMFEQTGQAFIPVVMLSSDADSPAELLGALFHVDALRAYNRALAATAEEEHS